MQLTNRSRRDPYTVSLQCILASSLRATSAAPSADAAMARTDAENAQLDAELLAYLGAYQDYMTLHLELETALKEGNLALARARRELSRTHNTGTPCVSSLQFPSEFEAMLRLEFSEPADDATDPAATLTAVWQNPSNAPRPAPEGGAKPTAAEAAEAESEAVAALARFGVNDKLRQEIAAAVVDDGGDVAMSRGDVMACEGGSVQRLSSQIGSASSLGDLKSQLFASMMSEDDAPQRPKPQQRPGLDRDPLRWFAVLPPLPLRQAQKCFRRAAERSVALANASARMEGARARYESLGGTSALPAAT